MRYLPGHIKVIFDIVEMQGAEAEVVICAVEVVVDASPYPKMAVVIVLARKLTQVYGDAAGKFDFPLNRGAH
ncbi:hypothetical protein ALQ37_200177 [Pseudomonas syringae pv. aptata]|uniref:Uncharacterized protein n=1 Tax=Pseudomonas syringae pv. aptata TaxID=83167 RepID=A0A3M3XNN5_PSEAP|nr:hypothetical protein ALQ37_200177 [Pseudomonas syringae pv. aptata]